MGRLEEKKREWERRGEKRSEKRDRPLPSKEFRRRTNNKSKKSSVFRKSVSRNSKRKINLVEKNNIVLEIFNIEIKNL